MTMTMRSPKLDAEHRSVDDEELTDGAESMSDSESENASATESDGDGAPSARPASITLNSVALTVDVDWETQIAIDAFLDSHS